MADCSHCRSRLGLAFVPYSTPALRVFWKRFLTPLRVAQQKNLDPVLSYGLRTSAQSSRSVDTRGALKRFLTPPKRICSLWMTSIRVCDVDRRPTAPGRRAAAVAAAPTSTPKLAFAGKTFSTPAETLYSTLVGLQAGRAVAPVSALDAALSAFRARCA